MVIFRRLKVSSPQAFSCISWSVGFEIDHVSETASRIDEWPRNPPCLLLWWITTNVHLGKAVPLFASSQ